MKKDMLIVGILCCGAAISSQAMAMYKICFKGTVRMCNEYGCITAETGTEVCFEQNGGSGGSTGGSGGSTGGESGGDTSGGTTGDTSGGKNDPTQP